MPPLRIGYVNVQGLSQDIWELACRLLYRSFDFLFLAETWYVNYDVHRHDGLLIATTERPVRPATLGPGRRSGGIYLLATRQARAWIKGDIRITNETITFAVGKRVITGVYFPPSMPDDKLQHTLRTLSTLSTTILGDVNTRFVDPVYQQGASGPPGRVAAFSELLRRSKLVHIKPEGPPTAAVEHMTTATTTTIDAKLTVDHCFAVDPSMVRLLLLNNKSIGIRTDHRYTLALTLFQKNADPTARVEDTTGCYNEVIHRYRTSKLSDPSVCERVTETFERLALQRRLNLAFTSRRGESPDPGDNEVDDLNRLLVRTCQATARLQLGCSRIGGSGKRLDCKLRRRDRRVSTPEPGAPSPLVDRQTNQAAIRLYKKAVASSKENGLISPTESARQRGLTACTENYRILKQRYSAKGALRTSAAPATTIPALENGRSRATMRDDQARYESMIHFSRDEIRAEIMKQDGNKACGSDGIHIRLLRALIETSLIDHLHHLFKRCIQTGLTPLEWNQTEIHLLAKDVNKAREAPNLRPITLICMFRKIFEKLLFKRFDPTGWARLHPCQAGFRDRYSTYTNAALVHHLLSSGKRRTAVFLDFRLAFDVIDHVKLKAILVGRGCPAYVLSLIHGLMFKEVRSRLLINGTLSGWFERSRGVLQGSPLSPYLFNIFIDGLVELLNPDPLDLPLCLFYADDGTLLAPSERDMAQLLPKVDDWCGKHGIELNVAKCGHLSQNPNPDALYISGQLIRHVDSYDYLGFPVRNSGIDFESHLERRTEAAVKRSAWIGLYSDGWGAAHRIRVYKQYLAPMFEYGAPLVHAWASQTASNSALFRQATKRHSELMAWIVNTKAAARSKITMNLCGTLPLLTRFSHLRTAYQWTLEQSGPGNPLRKVLDYMSNLASTSISTSTSRRSSTSRYSSFICNLSTDKGWTRFKAAGRFSPTVPKALKQYLLRLRTESIKKESQKRHSTAIIPLSSRTVPGLALADISLAAPASYGDILLQYRRGTFMFGYKCGCENVYHRGHEFCSRLPHPITLTKAEKMAKEKMWKSLPDIDPDAAFTTIDFLLNTRQLERAFTILSTVKKALAQIYSLSKQPLVESEVD